jgi:hypothetical protein
MAKSLIEIGQEEFEKNETNFFKRIKQIITEDESPFDETTEIKVFCNFHEDCRPYFRFNISTFRMELSTDYYRYDYIYKEGNKNNIDELVSNIEDVEIFTFFGDDISNPNNI